MTNNIISESSVSTNGKEFNIININSKIDNFNYEILINELEARKLMGEHIFIIDFTNCISFSIDAIVAISKLNSILKKDDGVIYLVCLNEKIKKYFLLAKKLDEFQYFKTKEELISFNNKQDTISNYTLTIYKDNKISSKYIIKDNKITIGRESSCDICLSDNSNTVSRRHATIENIYDNLILISFGKNGTYINNELITKSILVAGSTFKIDKYLFLVSYDGK